VKGGCVVRRPELKLEYHVIGKSGKVILKTRLGDVPVYTEKLDLSDPKARRRYCSAVIRHRPLLNRRKLEAALERMADDAVRSADDQTRMTQAGALVEIGTSARLFHDGNDTAYARIEVISTFATKRVSAGSQRSHRETHAIRQSGFRQWLMQQFHLKYGKVPGSQAMQEAIDLLSSKAVFEGPRRSVALRVGMHRGALYLDLANDRWEAVRITRRGWQVVERCPLAFIRRRGMQPLPRPKRGGDIGELRSIINAGDDANLCLIVSWLIAALSANGPYPVLAVNGQQGSGKSLTCRMLRRLIDPNEADLRSAPRDERALMVAATNAWVVMFDNLSRIPNALSDALCRLSTGGGFGTRALYTDDSEKIFRATRPVLFNGIEELATRPDLLDRSIVLTLPTISDRARKTDKKLWREYHRVWSRVLGALLDAISTALRNLAHVTLPVTPRMADFASWVVAAEPKLPWKRGTFLRVYEANRRDASRSAIEVSSVGPALLRFMHKRPQWTGTMKQLLKGLLSLVDFDTRRRSDWPKSPRGLAGELARIAPALPSAGIRAMRGRRGREGYKLKLERMQKRCAQRSQVPWRRLNREHCEHGSPQRSKKTQRAAPTSQPAASRALAERDVDCKSRADARAPSVNGQL
jgi:hypothetical protein